MLRGRATCKKGLVKLWAKDYRGGDARGIPTSIVAPSAGVCKETSCRKRRGFRSGINGIKGWGMERTFPVTFPAFAGEMDPRRNNVRRDARKNERRKQRNQFRREFGEGGMDDGYDRDCAGCVSRPEKRSAGRTGSRGDVL